MDPVVKKRIGKNGMNMIEQDAVFPEEQCQQLLHVFQIYIPILEKVVVHCQHIVIFQGIDGIMAVVVVVVQVEKGVCNIRNVPKYNWNRYSINNSFEYCRFSDHKRERYEGYSRHPPSGYHRERDHRDRDRDRDRRLDKRR